MNLPDTIKITDEIFFEQNEVSKNKTFDRVNNSLKDCNGGELYFENTDFETLYFADSRIQNISQNSSQGFGFRSIRDDTIAFSSSDNITFKNIVHASKTVNSINKSNNKQLIFKKRLTTIRAKKKLTKLHKEGWNRINESDKVA